MWARRMPCRISRAEGTGARGREPARTSVCCLHVATSFGAAVARIALYYGRVCYFRWLTRTAAVQNRHATSGDVGRRATLLFEQRRYACARPPRNLHYPLLT